MPSLMPFSLCSCYPNRKSSQKSEEFIVVDGEEPYARIVKKRNSSRHASSGGSQMDACTTFPASLPRRLNDHPNYRLSIAGEIDIDEISGYATIMKTPKLPRRTAELSSCHEPFQNDIGNVIGVRKASSASQSHINNTSFGSNTLPAKSKLPVYTKPVRRPSVPSRSSLNSINNNKIEIIRRTTVRRSQDTSSSSLSGRRSSSDSGSSLSTMAMIATVHPYNRRNSSGISAGVGVGNGAGAVAESGGFKIEDVTDDPKYKSDDESELEGAIVEYCRIDSRHRTPPQHNICEADTIVSARSHAPGGHYEIKDTRLHPAITTSSTAASSPLQRLRGVAASETVVNKAFPVTVAQPKMAYVVDIEVGQPCSAKAQCKCFGFRPHQWRKVCVHCKCDRSEHELGPNQVLNVYERLGIAPPSEMAAVMKNQRNDVPGSVSHGYAWVPPGLTRIKVEEYMSQLPNHVIPRLNSLGEKYREKQLMLQLPKQDLSIAYCKNLRTPVEKRIYEEFINGRNEVALDIGYVSPSIAHSMECRKCRGALDKGDMAVMAPKLGENAAWHPACFICATCEQLLVDLTYCVREDKIHCERHYAELHKPRCSACDELIFSGEYTKAMNKDWHSDHFCCWNCDTTLTGQRYILRDEHPFCIKCYEEVFANTCDECGKSIGIDSKDLSWAQKHWHEDCFLCNMCKISLVDKPFGSKNDRIFCSNCYDQAFATRCDGCNEIFRAGMKKMEYKGKQWHDKCFCCASCKVPIGTKSFIPKNEDVYCATCYEDKFATRCSKCSKVITTGGVTYKQSPWHRECFCCTNCNVSLAGQRFTSKDDKPYCAACYGDLFAKRCNACLKPITGIGGAKFISFEDRHWHNDCFICAQCTTSLVGKGFITDASDILCPECAKARLMAANS